MVDSLNLTGLTVNSDGRVSFSGLTSGIDFQAAVDAIIAAKQIPADRISAEIAGNEDKIAAFQEARTLLTAMQQSLKDLYGAISLGSIQDIFKAKAAFASTSRTDGATPASASDLIGVSVTNAAALGQHTLEVLRTAKAHKISSDAVASTTTALGYGGTFTINGTTITIGATDTLADIRDRINNANSGASATGVTASIVNAGTGANYLVLTADEAGTAMTVADTSGTPLQSLGIVTGGSTIKNTLQTPQTARLKADGLLDPDRYESDLVSSASALLNTLTSSAGFPGSFDITGGTGSATINYTASDTLTSLKDKINLETVNTGVTATIVTENGGARLVLTEGSAAAITLTDTNGLLAGLGVDNGLIVERSTNTIDDLFAGVTLSLFAAQEGTTISIDVDRDLTQVKTAIGGFVSAYNDFKVFLNEQNLVDETTGKITDDTGVLFGNRTLATIASQLSGVIGAGATGVTSAFTVLAQIGIGFVDNNTVTDPTLKNTLEVDDSKLDEALLNDPDAVRKLFSFNFASSDPRVSLLGFNGATQYSASGYTVNIGGVFLSRSDSALVNDKTAMLSDAVNSVGATTAGTFDINGVAIAYDADGAGGDDDTLETLATAITNAGIAGVSATVVQNSDGKYQLQINSTIANLVIDNDSGDLLSKLNLQAGGYTVGSANIDGAAGGAGDGSATVAGRVITATDATGAEGLRLLYTGTSDLDGVTVTFSVGIGAQLFFALDEMLKPTVGAVESEISAMQLQNDDKQARLDRILERLAYEKDSLLDRFIAMETILASLSQTRDFLTQYVQSLSNNNN